MSRRAVACGRSSKGWKAAKPWEARALVLPGLIATLTAALVAVPTGASAQAEPHGAQVRTGPGLDHYSFSDAEATGIRSLSLFSFPVHGVVPVSRRVTLEARGAFARGSLERADGQTVSVSGLTDTELRVGVRFPGTTVVHVQGIAQLPTGNATHTAEEAQVAGALASDLLPFRISNWGSGGGLGAHTSVARSFGETGAGMSLSYLVAREFEPIEEAPFGYRPGNQLRIRAAVDHDLGPSRKVTFTLTMERHSDDALEGTNLYRAGNRVFGVGSFAFQAGRRGAALVYGGVFHRSEGTALLEAAPSMPSQQLFLAGGGVRMPVGWGVLVPGADVRVHRSADGVGQGWVTGLGVSAEVHAGGQILVPAVRARFGNVLVREGLESGITGLEVSLETRFGR